MKTAMLIKKCPSWNGDARLYRLSPPLADSEGNAHEFVVVSGVIAPFSGAETYIFPATEDGEAKNYGELEGSFRGSIDHEGALSDAGYEVSS